MEVGDRKDIILAWSDLVTGMSTDLWSVALAFLIAQILVFTTLLRTAWGENRALKCLVGFSLLCSILSLFFGYFTKGAVIGGLENLLKPSSEMKLPEYPAFDAFVQAVSLLLSLVTFVFAFGYRRDEMSRALLGILGR